MAQGIVDVCDQLGDGRVAESILGLHDHFDRIGIAAEEDGKAGIILEAAIFRQVVGADQAQGITARGIDQDPDGIAGRKVDFLLNRQDHQGLPIDKVKLVDRRIVRPAAVRIIRPGVEAVFALAPDDVVVALATIDDVVIGWRTFRRAVAPENVVPAEAEDGVGAKAAEDLIPALGSKDDVIAGTAVDYADKIAAAFRQDAHVEGVQTRNKPDDVVPAQPADADLLHQGLALGRLPCG